MKICTSKRRRRGSGPVGKIPARRGADRDFVGASDGAVTADPFYAESARNSRSADLYRLRLPPYLIGSGFLLSLIRLAAN